MLRAEDVKLRFESEIDIAYKDKLDRLFFFNRNQHKYEQVVEQSIVDYAMPVLQVNNNKVAIKFEEDGIGQTLHILDSNQADAELIGVVMFARDSTEIITIVHFVLHEECREIMRNNDINVAVVVLEKLMVQFRKLKGVKKIRFYYTDKFIKI